MRVRRSRLPRSPLLIFSEAVSLPDRISAFLRVTMSYMRHKRKSDETRG